MLTPHRSSRVLLVANGRGAAGSVPVRRYRLARVRVSGAAATAVPQVVRAKRG